jgi:hypothetical protein
VASLVKATASVRVGHTPLVSGDDPIIDVEYLLNPDEQDRFRRLCLPTSVEDMAGLPEVVKLHLSQITDQANPNADLETAEKISQSLLGLLTSGEEFGADERALIRGAVEYFLMADDAADDLDDVLGFDDDARVVNSVLDRINRPQFRVEPG